MKNSINRYGALALILLLSLNAGYALYGAGNATLSFRHGGQSSHSLPSDAGYAFAAYSLLPNILSPVPERNAQQNTQPDWIAKHHLANLLYASEQLFLRSQQYIRYAAIIEPSLEATRIIYPFHTHL